MEKTGLQSKSVSRSGRGAILCYRLAYRGKAEKASFWLIPRAAL
jgi:hypothetical protein